MNSQPQTAPRITNFTAECGHITFEGNTYLDRALRSFVMAFYRNETCPVIVSYGDPIVRRGDLVTRQHYLSDDRAVRIDDESPRHADKPGTLYITAERKKA